MDSNTPPVFGRAQGSMAQSGRARGLLLPAAEATIGASRGAIFTSLEPQQRPGPSAGPISQHVRLPQLNRPKSYICFNFFLGYNPHIRKSNIFGCLQLRMTAHRETSAAEAAVGAARGAIFTSLEPQQPPGPSSDPMSQHVRLLQPNWRKSDICFNFVLGYISHIMKGNFFGCLQVRMPAHGKTSALVSMFRGIGFDYSLTPLGRGKLPVGQY